MASPNAEAVWKSPVLGQVPVLVSVDEVPMPIESDGVFAEVNAELIWTWKPFGKIELINGHALQRRSWQRTPCFRLLFCFACIGGRFICILGGVSFMGRITAMIHETPH